MFYKQLLCAQILEAQKNTYGLTVFFERLGLVSVKAAHRTLMKLTPGVNFINFICTHFSYERRFSSFFSSYMYVTYTWKKLPKRNLYEKLTPGGRHSFNLLVNRCQAQKIWLKPSLTELTYRVIQIRQAFQTPSKNIQKIKKSLLQFI